MKALKVFLIMVMCLGLVVVSKSYADDTSEAILKLLIKKGVVAESEVNELKSEVAKKEKEKPMAVKLAEAIQPAGDKDGLIKIKGYVQTRYESYNHSADRFLLKSAYIVPHGTIYPGWDFEVEFDVAASAPIVRNAFIEYNEHKPLKLRIGQQKPSFTEEFWTSSSLIDTIERAQVVTTISSERDIGVNLLGKAANEKINYGIGIFNGAGVNTAENNDGKDIVGRAMFSPWKGNKGKLDGLSLGGAFWTGKQPQTTFASTAVVNDRTRYAATAIYKYERLKLQSEYINQQFDKTTTGEVESEGWYLLGVYDLKKKDKDPVCQLVGKYEQYDANVDANRDRQDITTIGLNHYFNKYTKLMLNYRIKNEQSTAETSNNEFLSQLQVKF